ncbi:MAG: amidohydrolase family protein [Bacteroidota bacterium]
MRKICADIVYPVSQPPIKNGIVVIEDDGTIAEVVKPENFKGEKFEYHPGVIMPGFINTHCHLELSHMEGKVDTGTSLIPFITAVVQKRNSPQEEIDQAIINADREMFEAGIVAVGDISNQPDTFKCKAESQIRYYTFVEMFDFLQNEDAEKTFEQYAAVYDQCHLGPGDQKSMVPHAPYSVSEVLFKKLRHANAHKPGTISIHNQETPPENKLFLSKTGGFVSFYKGFDISLDQFEAPHTTSIHYALANMDPSHRTLFVHNTLTTREDVKAAQLWSDNTFWASCPNANLYIENRLPDYQVFIDTGARVTLGTDSLTSNWQLSILEEMKTIARFQSYVSFETLVRWATLNGAQALGFDQELGSFEPGKRPGINLITFGESGRFDQEASVRRLA